MIEEIVIDSVETEDKLSIFRGRFVVKASEYTFSGIAYMGYGGPNVNVSLEDGDKDKILASGFTEEELQDLLVELQQRILNGDFKTPRQS